MIFKNIFYIQKETKGVEKKLFSLTPEQNYNNSTQLKIFAITLGQKIAYRFMKYFWSTLLSLILIFRSEASFVHFCNFVKDLKLIFKF